MHIGIYAPYTRSEATLAAARLAVLASGLGCDVSWLSADICTDPVLAARDGRVISPCGNRLEAWLKETDAFIWFGPFNPQLQLLARQHGRKTARHTAVTTSAAEIPPRELSFDALVCPNALLWDQISMNQPLDGPRTRLCWWSCGLAATPKPQKPPTSALLYCDAYTWRQYGRQAIDLARQVDQHLPQIQVNLAIRGRPSRGESRAIVDAGLALRATINPSWEQLMIGVNQNDWLVHLGVRHDYGLLADVARQCRVPVIGWNVQPLNTFLLYGEHGVLAPCPRASLAGHEVAGFDVQSMFKCCCDNLPDTEVHNRLRLNCQQDTGQNPDKIFRAFWRELLFGVE